MPIPALVDEGETVGVQLLPDADQQYESMWSGTSRLLRLNVGGSARMLNDLLDNRATLALATSPHGSKLAWVNDAADSIFSHLLGEAGGPVWTDVEFAGLVERVRAELPGAVETIGREAVAILVTAESVRRDLAAPVASALHPAYLDMQAQLDRLVYPHHLSGVGAHRLADVARYLDGIRLRLDKLPDRVAQDRRLMLVCRALETDFENHTERLAPSAALEDLNWQLEEFRLASFAQQVGVKEKVSEKRIRTALRGL